MRTREELKTEYLKNFVTTDLIGVKRWTDVGNFKQVWQWIEQVINERENTRLEEP